MSVAAGLRFEPSYPGGILIDLMRSDPAVTESRQREASLGSRAGTAFISWFFLVVLPAWFLLLMSVHVLPDAVALPAVAAVPLTLLYSIWWTVKPAQRKSAVRVNAAVFGLTIVWFILGMAWASH